MKKQPPETPAILKVVKSAQPVNKSGQPDRFVDKLGIQNYRLVKVDNVRDRTTGETGKITIPLFMNGAALIDYEIVSDDGIMENRFFVMIGKTMDGRELPAIKVAIDKFPAMSWVLQWGNRIVVAPGNGNKDNARAAIQVLSGDVPIEREYRHTGWRIIDGRYHYLTGNGAINADGLNESTRVELDPGHMQRYQLPAPGAKTKHCARLLLELLQIAPKNLAVGAALVCAVTRAPLAEAALIDFSIFFAGQSGSFKSEIAALAMGFFGNFCGRSFPSNFKDTEADMQHKAHQAKDAVFVVDEFNPNGSHADPKKMHAAAENIFRSVGNQSGRGRRNSDMSGKAAYYPRGMVVSTGEDIPKGASLLGRMLVLELKKGDISKDVLLHHQTQRQNGLYVQGMATYLQWLAPRMDDLKRDLPHRIVKLRNDALNEGFAKSHSRAADIYASMMAGFDVFLNFLIDAEIISEVRIEDLYQATATTMKGAILAQAEYQQQSDEVEVFRELLQSCFASNRAHVACHLKQGPPQLNEHLWGWRASEKDGEVSGKGDLIGWINEPNKQLWLDPNATFAAIQRLASTQGESFLLSKSTLWKRLMERNLLLDCEVDNRTGKLRPTVKRAVCGKSPRVLVFMTSFITNTP